MLNAGTYKVEKIVACYLGESPEKKTPFFAIDFLLENGESIEWKAWLSTGTEKAVEAANKNVATLAKLGYLSDKISDMANDTLSIDDLFGEPEDEISVVVEIEGYQDKNGNNKEKAVIKWVNVGQQNNVQKFAHKEAIVKFKSLPFDGALKKAKAGEKPTPKKDTAKPAAKAAEKTLPDGSADDTEENSPF